MKKLVLLLLLLVSVINVNSQNLPKGFELTTDKFTGKSTLKYNHKMPFGVEVIKLIKNSGSVIIMLSISAYSSRMIEGQNIEQERQVILLFTDGTTYDSGQQKIYSGKSEGDNYRYNAYLEVTENLLNILKTKVISAYRIGSLDYELYKKVADLKDPLIFIKDFKF